MRNNLILLSVFFGFVLILSPLINWMLIKSWFLHSESELLWPLKETEVFESNCPWVSFSWELLTKSYEELLLFALYWDNCRFACSCKKWYRESPSTLSPVTFAFFFKATLLCFDWHTKNCTYLMCVTLGVWRYVYTCEIISTINAINISITSKSFLLPSWTIYFGEDNATYDLPF